jgi:shikimate kinase
MLRPRPFWRAETHAEAPPVNVFLVGPMGSGKSAVGRQLARRLGLAFVDSDDEIERRTGVDIPFIFEKEGEAGFRQREAEVIDELTRRDGVLLATGGGAVLAPANRERLRSRGCVVYLRTSVDQQLQRTRHGNDRPLLDTPDPRGTLLRLQAQRAPLYEEAASIVVDTDGCRVGTVVERICRELAVHGSGPGGPAP